MEYLVDSDVWYSHIYYCALLQRLSAETVDIKY